MTRRDRRAQKNHESRLAAAVKIEAVKHEETSESNCRNYCVRYAGGYVETRQKEGERRQAEFSRLRALVGSRNVSWWMISVASRFAASIQTIGLTPASKRPDH